MKMNEKNKNNGTKLQQNQSLSSSMVLGSENTDLKKLNKASL